MSKIVLLHGMSYVPSIPVYAAALHSDPLRVQVGRGVSQAVFCDGFYAQKRGAEEVHGEKR